MKFSKQHVIEAQLHGAIMLVAQEGCCVPAHTLIMASEELIRTIYVARKIDTPYDYRKHVRPEKHDDYLRATRRKYNFFKHADRDIDESLELDVDALTYSNVVDLSLHIMGYHSLFNQFTDPMKLFMQWFAISYPDFIKWDKVDMPDNQRAALAGLAKGRPDQKRAALRIELTRANLIPRLDANYWIYRGKVDL